MQLVAYGAQDIYLTGNPQITFFKVQYRRHTNFAIESIRQVFNGSASTGTRVTATISRNGDLIGPIYLQATLPSFVATPASAAYVSSLGHALISEVEVEIGGQRIDKQYGWWLEVWSELSQSESALNGYRELVAKALVSSAASSVLVTNYTNPGRTNLLASPANGSFVLKVPFQFWFNRNPGLYLPLIALQYHEVKINLTLASATLICTTAASATFSSTPELWVDYVYLDTDERRKFAQVSHEYLIEQLQFTGTESVASGAGTVSYRLNFNHPTKELIWHLQDQTVANGGTSSVNPFFFANPSGTGPASNNANLTGAAMLDWFNSAKLQLNGHDRFESRDALYFRNLVPWQCHTRVPRSPIYVYSFALKPEEHQPSGTLNFSRIDNATLQIAFSGVSAATNLFIYCVNYNVLRIMSGMGGLAYSD